jgi:hypothetical protein
MWTPLAEIGRSSISAPEVTAVSSAKSPAGKSPVRERYMAFLS